ncbi:MAG TPA: ATP-binding protein [Polyangiales bacterium]|nr:ATP-binding protein [Polyangiales bacterium]
MTASAELGRTLAAALSGARAVLEAYPSASLALDLEGRIRIANREAASLLSRSESELEGVSFESLLAERHREELRLLLQSLNDGRTGTSSRADQLVSLNLAGPRELSVRLAFGSLQSSAGQLVLVSLFDVSAYRAAERETAERKSAERAKLDLEVQLRQAHKLEALGTLAGGIAHDFNNLLGVMIALTDLIEWEQGNPAQVRLHLDDMRATTRRASDLVRQILSFSRRQKFERRPLRLDAPLQEALKMLRATLPSTLRIDALIDSDAPLVLADPTQINQVLVNLATNAAHAIGESQGNLWVSMKSCELEENSQSGLRAGRYVRLSVRDDGAGMDAATAARVFEPFFTTKPAGQGTGLGLTIVQGIVAEHEGHITLKSEPGLGTSFEILLPEYALETSEVLDLAPDVRRGRGETVLLIDDERHLCESLYKLLEKLGYQPTGRTDPLEALELVRGNPGRFDVVLTDLTMPGLSGVDLARAINALPGAVPLVMMTGFSGSWTAEALQTLGVAQLVSKPVTARELSAVLRNVLDRGRLERQSA